MIMNTGRRLRRYRNSHRNIGIWEGTLSENGACLVFRLEGAYQSHNRGCGDIGSVLLFEFGEKRNPEMGKEMACPLSKINPETGITSYTSMLPFSSGAAPPPVHEHGYASARLFRSIERPHTKTNNERNPRTAKPPINESNESLMNPNITVKSTAPKLARKFMNPKRVA